MTAHLHRSGAWLALLTGMVLLTFWASPVGAATTFTVTKTGDAKDRAINGVCDTSREGGRQCTLRAAIQEANSTAGADMIVFDIRSAATVKTVSPTRPLPTITEPVTIDGYTQGSKTATTSDDARSNDNPFTSGSDAIIKVMLNGANAGAEANGLRITGSDSTISGLAINRFARSGILIEGSGATGNKVEGNFIGTNASGSESAGNTEDGVRISGASGNAIGGTEPAQRNVVSGNGSDGIEIGGSEAALNKVEANYVGTDASVTQDLGNAANGVYISGAPENVIGGESFPVNAGNLVSGNDSDGVAISGIAATGNKVGTLGNSGHGVRVDEGASGNTIGGSGSSGTLAGNNIVNNGGDGVSVASGAGNRILASTNTGMYSNAGLGIDLGDDDVTANDEDDPDTGANNLQNFPVITAALNHDVNRVDYSGTLNSTPNQTFIIQFFGVDQIDASDHGEGDVFIGQLTVTTDGQGNATFGGRGAHQSEYATATATNMTTGDTSEFSERVPITVD